MTSASLALGGWSASPGGAALAEVPAPRGGRVGASALRAGRCAPCRGAALEGTGVVAVGGERTHTVSVRLSPVEHGVWVGAARAAGRGRLGSWVRDRVAATLTAGAATTSPADAGGHPGVGVGVSVGEWAGLRAELGRVGNNLNQAVRLANGAGVNPARVAELADAAEAARTAVAELLAAVRAATGQRLVAAPVARSRSITEQLADADAHEVFDKRVRVAAERLYEERLARNRAELAERAELLRRRNAAVGESGRVARPEWPGRPA